MKKNSTVGQSPKRAADRPEGPITIGLDLGDRRISASWLSWWSPRFLPTTAAASSVPHGMNPAPPASSSRTPATIVFLACFAKSW